MHLNFGTNILQEILFTKHTEVILWGSKWKDYPFRNSYNNFKDQTKTLAAISMEQINNIQQINIRTLYSKSTISIKNHGDIYMLKIKYNSTVNITNKYKNMPIDTILSISELDLLDYETLLKTKIDKNILITILLSIDRDHEISIPVLESLLVKYDDNIQQLIRIFIKKFGLNLNKFDNGIKKYIADEIIKYKKGEQSYKNIYDNIVQKTDLSYIETVYLIDSLTKN